MNKSELIDHVARREGIPVALAARIINSTFDIMVDALVAREKVVISGFGALTVMTRKGFQGRNPRTGKVMQIPSISTPVFRVGKGLKGALNE